MGDHSDIDHTGLTGVGGSASGGETIMATAVTGMAANTYADAVSQSLAAGTYLIWGKANCECSTASTFITSRLWDGSTVYDESEWGQTTAGQAGTIETFAYVVLGSTTTVKVSCAFNQTGGRINDQANLNGTADKTTKLMWLKIA